MKKTNYKKLIAVSCKEYTDIRKGELSSLISKLPQKPCLAVIQIGNDKASESYIAGKKKDCAEVGIEMQHIQYSHMVDEKAVLDKITELNYDINVHGIIVQLPIPFDVKKIQRTIRVEKDVDGFRLESPFDPCTPKGIIDWVEYNDVELVGKKVMVIGRSEIVGKPLVSMLIDRSATVTCCHSKTDMLSSLTNKMDIVISAVGRPKKFDSEYFSDHQLIIDVGINRDESGKLCGDIDKDDVEGLCKHSYVTSVPGGVGLLTRLALLENTVKAYIDMYHVFNVGDRVAVNNVYHIHNGKPGTIINVNKHTIWSPHDIGYEVKLDGIEKQCYLNGHDLTYVKG